jgi:hypothetical protein
MEKCNYVKRLINPEITRLFCSCLAKPSLSILTGVILDSKQKFLRIGNVSLLAEVENS